MSAQPEEKNVNHYSWLDNPNSPKKRVNVNDLVSKMNEDKKETEKTALY